MTPSPVLKSILTTSFLLTLLLLNEKMGGSGADIISKGPPEQGCLQVTETGSQLAVHSAKSRQECKLEKECQEVCTTEDRLDCSAAKPKPETCITYKQKVCRRVSTQLCFNQGGPLDAILPQRLTYDKSRLAKRSKRSLGTLIKAKRALLSRLIRPTVNQGLIHWESGSKSPSGSVLQIPGVGAAANKFRPGPPVPLQSTPSNGANSLDNVNSNQNQNLLIGPLKPQCFQVPNTVCNWVPYRRVCDKDIKTCLTVPITTCSALCQDVLQCNQCPSAVKPVVGPPAPPVAPTALPPGTTSPSTTTLTPTTSTRPLPPAPPDNGAIVVAPPSSSFSTTFSALSSLVVIDAGRASSRKRSQGDRSLASELDDARQGRSEGGSRRADTAEELVPLPLGPP